MVFSRQLDDSSMPDKYGSAIVVPCKAPVNNVDDLVEEARCLWHAEEKREKDRISANWSCVAVLENPEHPIPDDLRAGWREHVQQKPSCYGKLKSATGEATVVDEEGFLKISWPRTVTDNVSDLGVNALLATATNPTIVEGNYPSAQKIAAAWNAHEGEDYRYYVQYFCKNRYHEIKTFQDDDIRKLLRSQ